MEHLALYRKWRPQHFGELVGQEHISRTLLNALRQNRLAHAYLFCGPRGTGKTSAARLLAKALNCSASQAGEPCNQCQSCREITAGHSLDVIEIDAASNRGIDDARELREQVRFSASGGRYRIFIIDEFHMLTNEAFNALLKTLEEPPPNVIFVLATTEPHKVLQTIVSRCQRFDFQRIALPSLIQHLQQVARAEQIGISQQAIEAIARKAAGGLRDALSLLDQVHAMSSPGETLPDALVYQVLGLIDEEVLLQLTEALFQGDLEGLLQTLQFLLEKGHDTLQIVEELLQILRHLTLAELPAARMEELGVPAHLLSNLQALRRGLSQGQTISVMEQLVKTADRLHKVTQPEIWLEADLIQICLHTESALLQRLEALEKKMDQSLPVLQPAAVSHPVSALPRQAPPQRESAAVLPTPPPRPVEKPAVMLTATHPGALFSHEPVWDNPASKDWESLPETAPVTSPARSAIESGAAKVFSDQELKQMWQRFLTLVLDQQGPLYGWMSNGKLIHADPVRGIWHVRFSSRPHKEQVERNLKSGRINPLLEEVMGSPCQMLVELTGDSSTPPLPRPPLAGIPLPKPSGPLPPPPAPLPPALPEQKIPLEAVEIPPLPELPADDLERAVDLPSSLVEELTTRSTQPLEAVADLFKGKIIHQES